MGLLINGAFLPQRVTGQQRYAREITSRLQRKYQVEMVEPGTHWTKSPLKTWSWTQVVLPLRSRGSLLLSLTSRTPVAHRHQIVTVHDLFPLTRPEWYSSRYVSVHRPLLKHQLKHAVGIVTVSEPVAQQVRDTDLCRPTTPITVAPNAASNALVANATTEQSSQELPGSLRASTGFFMAVGSLEPRKNLGRLISAYSQLPQDLRDSYPLVLTGSTSPVFRDANLVLTDNVITLGYVADGLLAALYRQATAVVCPSLDEGFGLPLIEALTVGARVLASDIPVFRWVCGDAVEYFRPLEVESIRQSLQHAIDSPHILRRLPRQYSWEASAESVHQLAALLL